MYICSMFIVSLFIKRSKPETVQLSVKWLNKHCDIYIWILLGNVKDRAANKHDSKDESQK